MSPVRNEQMGIRCESKPRSNQLPPRAPQLNCLGYILVTQV
jgi:hypothetical protein